MRKWSRDQSKCGNQLSYYSSILKSILMHFLYLLLLFLFFLDINQYFKYYYIIDKYTFHALMTAPTEGRHWWMFILDMCVFREITLK